jgi:hypothetical protein
MIHFKNFLLPALAWLCSVTGAYASAEGDGEASWVRYENDHFVVSSDVPESAALLLLEDLENFRVAMIDYDGSGIPEGSKKTRVIIFASKEDFVDATHHPLAEAFTLGIDGAPHIVMSAEAKPEWSSTTLRHEFVHVLQGYAGDQLPWWYFEGFAECMSGMEFRSENTEFVVGGPTIRSRSRRSFVPWEQLIAEGFALDEAVSARQASSAYFQAGLLVRYLLAGDDPAYRGQLTEYLERVTSGESSAKAFEAVFDESADALGARVYKQRRTSIKPRSYRFRPDVAQQDFRQSETDRTVVQKIIDALRTQGP